MTPDPRSTLGGFVAILLWSTTVALGRSLAEQLGSLTAAAAVYLVAGLLGGLRLVLAGIPLRASFALPPRYLLGCGSLFAIYGFLLYLALGLARNRDEVLVVGLLNYLWPATTILLSLGLLGQRARWWIVPGTALALAGIFLVLAPGGPRPGASLFLHWRANPAGFGLATAAALSWALYSNLARRWGPREGRGAVELFLLATGLLLLLLRGTTTEATHWTPRALGEAATLGGLTTLAYILWERAMRRGDLLLVAAASYFTPLLSTLVSAAYLRVVPAPRIWLGGLLLVAGSLLSWWSTKPTSPDTPATPPRPPR
jgi:drug/metabolite transporter (DMT)-like permease